MANPIIEAQKRRYALAAELRQLMLTYGDICDGPTLESLGAAAGRAMTSAEASTHFNWNSIATDDTNAPEDDGDRPRGLGPWSLH